MRYPGLILASVLLVLLTACGGSDGNGDDDGSSPSSSDSTQSPGDDSSSDDGSSDDSSDDASDDDSSDDSSDDAEEETGTVEDLETAFTEYTKAFFQGKDDKALEYYTEECQEQTLIEEFNAASEQVAEAYKADFKLTITNAEVEDNTGKVEATYGIPEVDDAHAGDGYDWLFEDGEWRLNACF